MQASKLQYELECVQRPGAEILIDGVALQVISFDFDPSNNTTNLVTRSLALEPELDQEEISEFESLGEPELETPAETLELSPPVEKSGSEVKNEASVSNSGTWSSNG